jgi:hypothetical protein
LVRLKLVFCHPTAKTVAVSLSYLALLLYSQTDPGEFVPIPFAALGVLMFVLLEHHAEEMASDSALSVNGRTSEETASEKSSVE